MRGLSMKKFCTLILCVSVTAIITSACSIQKQSGSIIKSKRRFAQYVEPESSANKSVIDLSEGPKQRYDAYFGPKALNFDIKIEDPY